MVNGAGATDRVVRELIFGVIAPIGTDRSKLLEALKAELCRFGYSFNHVKLSGLIPRYLPGNSDLKQRLAENPPPDERKQLLMDAGNFIRKDFGLSEAVALMGVVWINEERDKAGMSGDILRPVAWVIDSLKNPKEVERLRAIYGPAFLAIGVYSPPQTRRARILLESKDHGHEVDDAVVARLMARDEEESDKRGQRVQDAFEMADVVVDVTREGDLRLQIARLLDLLFGHPHKAPTVDEYGMFICRGSQVRSSSLARQVGAAALRADGSVVAAGRNEVAKPFGGQYDEQDDAVHPLGRDATRGSDVSDEIRRRVLEDVVRVWNSEQAVEKKLTDDELAVKFSELFYGDKRAGKAGALRKSQLMQTIDYVRAVHAEMAVIVDASRFQTSLAGTTLYTTTFPCHDCAKHIVAAGVRRVVYMQAYPKSLVSELFDDSIQVNDVRPQGDRYVQFVSFVGVAPSRYLDAFTMGKKERKDDMGRVKAFDSSTASISLPDHTLPPKATVVAEEEAAHEFVELATEKITVAEGATDE